jgi:hypothetical protein
VAISRVTGTTAFAINAGATTLNFDETVCLTDDLILVAWSCGDDDFTQPTLAMTTAGYTELTTSTLSIDGGTVGDGNLAVFYKYFAPGDVSAVTAASGTGTDSSNATACQIFRGVATVAQGGPLEIAIQTASATTPAGDPDPPSVSGFDETTAVVVIAGATCTATTSNTMTAPTGYTTNFMTVGAGAEAFSAAVGLGYREDPADPENPGAITSAALGAWCAATMVLKEAPAATPYPLFAVPDMALYPGPSNS